MGILHVHNINTNSKYLFYNQIAKCNPLSWRCFPDIYLVLHSSPVCPGVHEMFLLD